MKLNALGIGILLLLLCGFATYYITFEPISCFIDGAYIPGINGFYAAMGGVYVKRGAPVHTHPDVFGIIRLKRSLPIDAAGLTTISLGGDGYWSIDRSLSRREVVYRNAPEHPELYLYHPPATGWKMMPSPSSADVAATTAAAIEIKKGQSTANSPLPQVTSECIGSLQDSAPINSSGSGSSDLSKLLQRPVTTVLLCIIFWVAYKLWTDRIEVSAVSYSYEMFLLQQQYWRAVTASFSHFDLMHLGFNCMALYSLGDLESVYGSTTFLYLSVDLVVITMIICTIIYHVMITRFGRHDLIAQQAVGYSCVLFAWMVALSARLREYCPIFLFPSFCIETWFIPLPTAIATTIASWGLPTALPVNLGPFVLLLLTKLIIPRSSFIGHLSGIIIGYPLAWNMLNGITPPVLLSLLALTWIVTKAVWVPMFPGYQAAMEADMTAFVSLHEQRAYKAAVFCAYSLLLLLTPALVYSMGAVSQLLLRVTAALLLWSAATAARVSWYISGSSSSSSSAVLDQCAAVLIAAAAYFSSLIIYDSCNLISALTARQLLLGCSLSASLLTAQLIALTSALLIELLSLLCIAVLATEVKAAVPMLQLLRADKQALLADLRALNLQCCIGSTSSGGRGNRLMQSAPTINNNSSSRSINYNSSNNRSNSSSGSKGAGKVGTIALPPLGAVPSPSSPVGVLHV